MLNMILSSFLLDHGILKSTNQLDIWHDILNNSLTPHESNNNTDLTPKALATEWLKYESRLTALVYCECIGEPQAFDDLRDQDLTVIRVTECLLLVENRLIFLFRMRISAFIP